MNDVDDLLRRDGERWRTTATAVPRVDWAALPSRRRQVFGPSWWMVPVAGAAAAVVVALAVAGPSWIGHGGTGHKPLPAPAHRPSPAPTTGPASFVALDKDGITLVNARTGESYGESVSESGSRATALAGSDGGNLGYATFSHPHCRIDVVRYRWTSPTTSESTDAATVAGAKADAIAVSPDGHLLALSVVPCGKNTSIDDLVVVDLDAHLQQRWTGYRDVSSLSALQWAPDNKTLSYVVTPCCGGGSEGPRLLDTTARGSSYVRPAPMPVGESVGSGLVLWYGGQLAVVIDTEIRALSPTGGPGAVLARGLPADATSVESDGTGHHLLVTTQRNRLYRWDDGVLTALPGGWVDAGW